MSSSVGSRWCLKSRWCSLRLFNVYSLALADSDVCFPLAEMSFKSLAEMSFRFFSQTGNHSHLNFKLLGRQLNFYNFKFRRTRESDLPDDQIAPLEASARNVN